jgi:hypothetical protein
MVDFHGATISSTVGFLLVREVDDRFRIIDPMKACLKNLRSPTQARHSMVQMLRHIKVPRHRGFWVLRVRYAKNSRKIVLSCRPRNKLTAKEEAFRGCTLKERLPNWFLHEAAKIAA